MTRVVRVSCVAVLVAVVISLGLAGYRLYVHEKNQDEMIRRLSSRVASLQAGKSSAIRWGEGFNYLAIGNSITLHGYAEYWWDDDRGMAASADEKDYVRLVAKHLEKSYGSVDFATCNFSAWETNANDRAEFLNQLDSYLGDEVDLVTIQLGENVTSLDTYEADWEELLAYVKRKAPNARIFVIGDFWSQGDRDLLKETAAKSQSVGYISLEGIKDNTEYFAGVGARVEGSDGTVHVIEHAGVAKHPGDKGMQAIAEQIIDAL